ncbi:hypothetical protein BDN70DRAFT_834332 [Pholiota conissans]|uniref:Heterokaryon incompatibility domain-containing protein n=1 Tax=Pholiota conissans TaxID=109636 RepID=A0A9P6D1B3_9AGAR|nr:hypothetical protein BDN70DRAFT_834332 [Pholiota conissans]
MPLRLILLPQRKLIERSEIVEHIATKMNVIDESLLSKMHDKINTLGKMEHALVPDDQGEDARENPWKAIYMFLFQKYARYAVLSHTWLPSGEILYRDTLKDDWWDQASGSGLEKLRGFCDVAHRDHNVTLGWTDTLCINKDSSAELDESIQSMYKWYQNATVCITHLRDTTSPEEMGSDNWFQRGWTLQELIASRNIHFYGKNWTRLISDANGNDKANPRVQEIIYKATGIQAEDLVSFDPLKGSDVATRMRWAANRKTSRGEDRAYSLMGIFGVNFSISYGEGAERAFFRLIEAIISSRHTRHIIQILNWAGKAISDKVHPSNLIPSSPECYLHNNTEINTADPDLKSLELGGIYPALSEPMVLTHLGLRVRLLLVHLTETIGFPADPDEPGYGTFNISFKVHPSTRTFSLEKQFSKIPDTDSLLQFYNPQITTPSNSAFFLGIYTFQEDIRNDCIYLPFSACAFFLGIPSPYPKFSVRDISSSDFGPVAKIDTREVIQLYPEAYSGTFGPCIDIDFSKGCIVIKKESFKFLDMKLLDVYL